MPSNSTPPTAGAPGTGNVVALDQPWKKRPGRPRSISRAPTEFEREQHRRVADRLKDHVEADPVVQAASTEADRKSTAAIDASMLEIAREAAGLSWERRQSQLRGQPEAEKSASRKIDALSKLASLVLEKARVGGEPDLDPHDARFQKLVSLFFSQFRDCASEALGADSTEFVEEYMKRISGWEARV
jgi:hypothetical protein